MKSSNGISPKPKSLAYIFLQIVIRNAVFYTLLTLFMGYVYKQNLTMQVYGDNIQLLILLFICISIAFCFMEMRLVRENGTFLMPVLRFFIFLSKLLIWVIDYLFIFFLSNYIFCIVLNAASFLFTAVAVKLCFNKYDDKESYYIDYLLTKRKRNKLKGLLLSFISSVVLLVLCIGWLIVLLVLDYGDTNLIVTAVICIIILVLSAIASIVVYFMCKKKAESDPFGGKDNYN